MKIRKAAGILSAVAAFPFMAFGQAASDEWESAMQADRPRLPAKETRSSLSKALLATVKNSAQFDESKLLAGRILGDIVPQTAVWRTAFKSDEERIDICDFTADGGIANSFAVYGQLGNFAPYYWKVEGLPGGSTAPSKDFLRERCLVGESASVVWTEKVLSAEEVDISEMGESVPIPYSRFRFFFVDDRPGANWSHPCRYVFVSEDCSSFAVLYKTMPPRLFSRAGRERIRLHPFGGEIDGEASAGELEEIKAKVYGYADELRAENLSGNLGNAGKSYFVLISGGADPENNGIRFWSDTAMFYSTLTLKYGVGKDNIFVYVSDGTSPENDANLGKFDDPVLVSSPLDLDGDGLSDVDGAATKANLIACFANLRTRLAADDQLFVFITSHGDSDGTAGANNYDCVAWLYSTSGNAYFRDDELASWTSGFSCPVAFAIETCYSGGFVDDITNTAKRAIATACNHNESSWGATGKQVVSNWDNIGKIYAKNYWISEFIAAMRGVEPISMTSYGYPWSDSTTSVNADSNGDGLVSFDEARLCAYTNDGKRCTRSSHTATCGDDNDVEHPQYGESTSGLGARFFLLNQNSGSAPTISLQTALDNTSLAFTTDGTSPWFGQSGYSHDGVDAARSGTMSDSQSNWLETEVSGPCTISFWWYVSCEGGSTYTNWDYLAVSVDGVEKARIAGTDRAWEKKEYALPAGSHKVRWLYRKDGSQSNGLDAGFVDQVTWTPATLRPDNDNFANAKRISGSSGTATGSTAGATRESGEPLPLYRSAATNTIWWVWTAPASGSATFNTGDTGFDTVMGVYTGSTVSSLEAVAEDDDGGSSFTSVCRFSAVSGRTYYIAVSGYGNGSQGTVRLAWDLSASVYIVKFNRMDFSGATYTCTMTSGVAQALPSLAGDIGWSWSGHYFLGWADIGYSNGQVGVVKYVDGDFVKDLAQPGSTLYLYAVWTTTPLQRFPAILSSATSSAVGEVLDSITFADGGVKTVIGGSAREYIAFRAWAGGIAGGAAAVAASPYAAAAYLLGSTELFGNKPSVEIHDVAAGGASSQSGAGGAMTVDVVVKDGERTVAVDPAKVAAMFEATSDLRDWDGAAKLVPMAAVLGTDANGKMTFAVTPGDGTAQSAFVRIRK